VRRVSMHYAASHTPVIINGLSGPNLHKYNQNISHDRHVGTVGEMTSLFKTHTRLTFRVPKGVQGNCEIFHVLVYLTTLSQLHALYNVEE
jgi:hypothetical protein